MLEVTERGMFRSKEPLNNPRPHQDIRKDAIANPRCVVRNSGLPTDTSFLAVGIDTRFHLPPLPGPLTISPAPIHGMVNVKYGSGSQEMSIGDAKAAIIEDFVALSNATNSSLPETEFVIFKAHTPFQPTISKEDIADGFYKKLWTLQGHRQTYYTGAAWQSQDSAILWNFTEYRILPLLLR